MQTQLSRRKFILTAANCAVAASFGWMAGFEPFWLEVNEKQIKLPGKRQKPIRLVHLSDIHAFDETPLPFLEDVILQATRLQPDLICVTGDFISYKIPNLADITNLLKPLAKSAPTYACLGNHDGGAWGELCGSYETSREVEEVVRAANIKILKNESLELKLHGEDLILVGLSDLWSEPNSTAGFSSLSPTDNAPIVVMAHNPDWKDEIPEHPWHLMLSGHTHGGQLQYPLTGGTPFCVVNDPRFIKGMNQWRDRWIHTSRGIASSMGMRFNCRPELSVVTIT